MFVVIGIIILIVSFVIALVSLVIEGRKDSSGMRRDFDDELGDTSPKSDQELVNKTEERELHTKKLEEKVAEVTSAQETGEERKPFFWEKEQDQGKGANVDAVEFRPPEDIGSKQDDVLEPPKEPAEPEKDEVGLKGTINLKDIHNKSKN